MPGISLAGSGNGNGALRKGGSGVTTYSGAITMTANSTISMDSAATLNLSNLVSDAGGGYVLTASGGGILTLDATNHFSGGFTLNGPTVDVNTNGALGSGTVEISGAGHFVIASGLTITNFIQATTVSPGVSTGLLMVNDNTNGIITTISGPLEFDVTSANGGDFIGPISSGYLNVTGPMTNNNTGAISSRNGLVRFSGGGSYTTFTLNQGTASIGAVNGLCTNATISIAGSGAAVFDLNGFNQTLAGIADGAANAELVTNSAITRAYLTLNPSSSDTYSGVIGGNLSLVVDGSANLKLAGSNTYTGNTTINGGSLELANADIVTNTTVTIANGAVLQLDFSTTNQVGALVLNGVTQSPGIYNSTTASPYITGSGSLAVASTGPSSPAYLTNSISGNTLTFTWPAGQSWRLVSQTNSLSVGLTTNGWSTVSGGIDGSNGIAIDPTQPTVFYRLVYP